MITNVTTHERPGVYSVYEASAVISGKNSGGIVGLAAKSTGGTAGKAVRCYSYEDAVAAFGEQDTLTRLVEVILRNGASAVVAVPVALENGDYAAAFGVLGEREDLRVVTCDATDLDIQQTLRDHVVQISAARKERIAVVGGKAKETVEQLVQRAESLNSERVVLVAPQAGGDAEPPGCLAAAVAGAIAGQNDPAMPLGGAILNGLEGISQAFPETGVDSLIRGGVTVVEAMGGEISVIRGVTTRTKTGGVADPTWRELTAIRVVDDVIPTVRNALRARFTRAKNTLQIRSAIRSQVIAELDDKVRREVITGYGEVTASALADNPTVCLVEFSFTVAHGINQIWLSAKITI